MRSIPSYSYVANLILGAIFAYPARSAIAKCPDQRHRDCDALDRGARAPFAVWEEWLTWSSGCGLSCRPGCLDSRARLP